MPQAKKVPNLLGIKFWSVPSKFLFFPYNRFLCITQQPMGAITTPTARGHRRLGRESIASSGDGWNAKAAARSWAQGIYGTWAYENVSERGMGRQWFQVVWDGTGLTLGSDARFARIWGPVQPHPPPPEIIGDKIS